MMLYVQTDRLIIQMRCTISISVCTI